MVLSKNMENAPKRISEHYFSDGIKVNRKNSDRNPVLGKIERALNGGIKFSMPSSGNPGGRRIYGRSGPIHRRCSANFYSNPGSYEIHMNVHQMHMNPGAYFTGNMELKLSYDTRVRKEDLEKVRGAILGAGLKKGKLD